MRTILFLMMAIHCSSVVAQQKLDTIYANEKKTVALFFPQPIRQGIVGKQQFVFNYNREEAQYFGLLQATPGVESNLLAITNDGQVYAFILKYTKELPRLTYFIKKSESIGNEKPQGHKIEKDAVKEANYANRSTHFEKFSEYLLMQKPEKLARKQKKGLKLVIEKMVYNASEVYLVLKLENRSGIDFEMDYLNIFRINGNKKRRASLQKMKDSIVYAHNLPAVVKDADTVRFVYVLPKFVLGTNEAVQVELQEANGHRSLILRFKY